MDWDPHDNRGLESAFDACTESDLSRAARDLFYIICPGEAEHVEWKPPDTEVAASDTYVALTVLYLTVQQFAENLRQAAHFKKRTWQYLAAAMPTVPLKDYPSDTNLRAEGWDPFCQRCHQVSWPHQLPGSTPGTCWKVSGPERGVAGGPEGCWRGLASASF